ncbi:MAG: hypothetical protein HDS16_01020 [Bacteroides sp.]|nr:hypothetical protein [Bacteroides sp.]
MKTQNDPVSSMNTNIHEQEYLENGFSPTEQAMKYDVGPESRAERMSNGAVKGMAWLLGIVGVFALAILIAWMCNINKSPLDSYMASSEMALKNPTATKPVAANQFKVGALTSSGTAMNTITAQKTTATAATSLQTAATNATEVVSPAAQTSQTANVEATTVNTQNVELSATDKDRIEQEALEVIHGDFGNNPMRAKKLGADYALVQARVNQLLHS